MESRIEQHTNIPKEKKQITPAIKRANVKAELNKMILELREKYDGCDTSIYEELLWINSTSKIPEPLLNQLIKHISLRIKDYTSIPFTTKSITSDINDKKKLSKWLNSCIGRHGAAHVHGITITKDKNQIGTTIYIATKTT